MIHTYPDLGLNVMQHTPLHLTVYCAPLCDALIWHLLERTAYCLSLRIMDVHA